MYKCIIQISITQHRLTEIETEYFKYQRWKSLVFFAMFNLTFAKEEVIDATAYFIKDVVSCFERSEYSFCFSKVFEYVDQLFYTNRLQPCLTMYVVKALTMLFSLRNKGTFNFETNTKILEGIYTRLLTGGLT